VYIFDYSQVIVAALQCDETQVHESQDVSRMVDVCDECRRTSLLFDSVLRSTIIGIYYFAYLTVVSIGIYLPHDGVQSVVLPGSITFGTCHI